MNIMWYVGNFDEANWNLFARLGLTPTHLRESGRGMAAVQQNLTYKRELLAGDIVLAPAKGERFAFRATVVKPGRTLTVCEGRAYAEHDGLESLIATMTGTLMALPRRESTKREEVPVSG
jgi:acyl-CoA thioesterase FadM